MIIQCEECQARFRMDPKKVGPKGVRVRCARCKNVFTVTPEKKEVEPKDLPQPPPEAPPAPKVEPAEEAPQMPPAEPSTTTQSQAFEDEDQIPEFESLIEQTQLSQAAQSETEPTPSEPPPEESKASEEKPSAFEVAAGFDFTSENPKPSPKDTAKKSEDSEPPPAPAQEEQATEENNDPFAGFLDSHNSEGAPAEEAPPQSTEPGSEPKNIGQVRLKPSHPGLAAADEKKEGSDSKKSRGELTGTPLVMDRTTPAQRIARSAFILFVLLVGVTFSLLAMGVKPTPIELKVLLAHGYRGLQPGVNLLGYQGDIRESPEQKKSFELQGKLFNYSANPMDQPKLKLELFSPSGDFLSETILPCCQFSIAPQSTGQFQMTAELPDQKIGRYRVQMME